MNLEIAGKIAVVTGASVGIGREITKVLAAECAQTVVIARRGNLLATLQDEIEQSGGKRPLAIAADLYDRSVPGRIRDQVLKEFGHVDILVNNAGRGAAFKESSGPGVGWTFDLPAYAEGNREDTAGSAADAAEDAWDKAFAINLTSVRRMTQVFLPVMQQRKWGRIINITGGAEPMAVNAVHAAKAGVHAWAKGLSREMGKYGITVNCLAPGRIHSEQIDTRLYPTPESQEQFARAYIPLGYFGDPCDMAYMVTFLCSPKARYITGQRMYVDGGMAQAV
jgi:3-oxoacyl-[acyl-carrier protein] reductase